jgi:SNF2 family DNA or RNA helicase
LAYLAKRNSCFNWIDEYLEDHDKLILAAWHKKVINDLYDKYKHIGLKIDGSVPSKKRLEIEDKFQNDEKIKIMILQIDAGGEGLTLTASNAIAIIEMPDTPGQLIQVCDRGHRIGLKSDTFTIYFPFANGTIENKIADEIENSSKSLEAILDGKKGSGLFKYQFKNL